MPTARQLPDFDPGRTDRGDLFHLELRLGDTTSLLALVNREDDEIAGYTWANLGDTTACATCPRPLIRPFGSLIAQVTVTDTSGCVTTANLPVFVDERELLYAPTAFSPGRVDGNNDFFMLYGSPEIVVNINTLQVFDRWGALVADFSDLKVNDEAAGWDGTYAGRPLEQGTYVWSAEFTRFDGRVEVLGTVRCTWCADKTINGGVIGNPVPVVTGSGASQSVTRRFPVSRHSREVPGRAGRRTEPR